MEGFYKLVQSLITISFVIFGLTLIILLLLGPFRKTRGVAAIVLLYSSFLFGFTTWLAGLFITYSFWGIWGVLIGLFILGFGVVPIGMLACLINAAWQSLLTLVILLAITFGARMIGAFLIGSLEEKTIPEENIINTTASWDEESMEDDIIEDDENTEDKTGNKGLGRPRRL